MKTLLSVNITEPYLVLTRPNNPNAQNELASGPSASPIRTTQIRITQNTPSKKDYFSRLFFTVCVDFRGLSTHGGSFPDSQPATRCCCSSIYNAARSRR